MNNDEKLAIGVREAETEMAFSGHAVTANRFYVHMSPSWVRLTFAEQGSVNQTPVFRTAAALSIDDMISLNNLLTQMLAEVVEQKKNDSTKPEAQKDAPKN